LAAA
ncbi:NUDIX domain protein, partial [Vibrio cholerae HC-17A1]|jgi:hypothetical protein